MKLVPLLVVRIADLIDVECVHSHLTCNSLKCLLNELFESNCSYEAIFIMLVTKSENYLLRLVICKRLINPSHQMLSVALALLTTVEFEIDTRGGRCHDTYW